LEHLYDTAHSEGISNMIVWDGVSFGRESVKSVRDYVVGVYPETAEILSEDD
jgi:hypothetical protein